jgi:hypothetical protein
LANQRALEENPSSVLHQFPQAKRRKSYAARREIR